MRFLRGVAAAGLVFAAFPANAQSLPGKNLSVAPRVRAVTISHDTSSVSYSPINAATSAERLMSFSVFTPVPPTFVSVPSQPRAWYVSRSFADRTVVTWTALGLIAQGDSMPTLTLRGKGLPAIVNAWFQGDSMVVMDESDTSDTPNYDELDDLSVKIQTVGIAAAPTTQSALIARLRTLTDSSCTLGWITNARLCTSLSRSSASPSELPGYSAILDSAQARGSAVSDAAYLMLHANVAYLIGLVRRQRQ